MVEATLYVLAISFQVCGAIILLIGSLTGTKKKMEKVIEEKACFTYLGGKSVEHRDITEELNTLYLNRVAFVLLAFGYALGVLGDIGSYNKWIILLWIIGVSALGAVIIWLSCGRMANTNQAKYKKQYMQEYE